MTGSVGAGVLSGLVGLAAAPLITMLVARPPLLASTVAAGGSGRKDDGGGQDGRGEDDGCGEDGCGDDRGEPISDLQPGWPFRCLAGRHDLAMGEVIPLVSFLRRRGRCTCGAAIPRVNPLVEILAVAASGLVGLRIAAAWAVPAHVLLALVLVTVAVIDGQRHLIPTKVVYPATAVGFVLLAAAAARYHEWGSLGRSALAAVAASAFLWVLVVLVPTGMGQGDARLSLLLGLYLGWQSWRAVYIGLMLGFLAGAIGGLFLVAKRRLAGERGAMRAHIAFGPYLAVGTFAVCLWPSLAGG